MPWFGLVVAVAVVRGLISRLGVVPAMGFL